MAINKKNRNRATVDGKEYLWWVFDEQDQTAFDGLQIKVVCSDQTHFFKYGLQQLENERGVVFALRDYAKVVYLSAPKFENEDGIITRSGVCRLIEWCKKETHQVEHAKDGKNIDMTKVEKKRVLTELQKIMNGTY